MTQELLEVEAQEQTTTTCRHYWVIQPATGPVSPGVCQSCGLAKDFNNYIVAASVWGDDKSGGKSWGRKSAVSEPVASEEEEQGD